MVVQVCGMQYQPEGLFIGLWLRNNVYAQEDSDKSEEGVEDETCGVWECVNDGMGGEARKIA